MRIVRTAVVVGDAVAKVVVIVVVVVRHRVRLQHTLAGVMLHSDRGLDCWTLLTS